MSDVINKVSNSNFISESSSLLKEQRIDELDHPEDEDNQHEWYYNEETDQWILEKSQTYKKAAGMSTDSREDSSEMIEGQDHWVYNELTNEWEPITPHHEDEKSQKWEYDEATNKWIEGRAEELKQTESTDTKEDIHSKSVNEDASTEGYSDDLLR